ncbi:helix-turn-helix domain-containing protein [Lysinibacillus sp. GbtcB16]|uniref:helix-turn-helix domain-containing protein n=1 Tax=Lysinibacillus sp. GbtcB16 TaxID=2824761 RepID=UPI001C30F908|nr:helix-turn-helix domain-containing protein [Lysinibacillus sp. GbtcB16]
MNNQQPQEEVLEKVVVKREKTTDLRIDDKWKFNSKFESTVALPNELFDHLLELEDKKILKNKHAHVAYGYMFLQTWLYRYAKYSQYTPTVADIKQLLGFKADEKRINYIIKKDGVLDNEGLTETTQDFPVIVMWDYDDMTGQRNNFPTIDTMTDLYPVTYELKDMLKTHGIQRQTICKKPLHLYEREDGEEGTLKRSDFTTQIDIRAFDFCMEHVKELGLTGFFLYAYIVHMDGVFSSGFDASAERLAKELCMDKKTIIKYRNALRAYNMIELKHNNAVFNPDDVMLAPTNIPNEWWQFTDVKGDYLKFNSMEQKAHAWNHPEEYESVRRKFKKDTDEIKINGITINQKDLPF